jgi:Uncharacterized protein conserved in bacteria (DUF2066)
MTLRILILFVLFSLASRPLQAQRYADIFSVEGIEVDVKGPTAEDARVGAFRVAAKKGWGKLWDKLVDPGYKGKAPAISDADVYRVVSSIDVSNERMSATRYIARIAIAFDPGAVRAALARSGAGFTQSRNRAMLLMPVLVDGGAATVYEPGNPWALTWAKFPLIRSSIEYIRAEGTLADTMMLNSFVARNRSPEVIASLLGRYRADGVVVAKATLTRTYPGGPVSGVFAAYTGNSTTPVDQFTLRCNSDTLLTEMLEEAIKRLDIAFSANAKTQREVVTGPVKLGRVVAVGGVVALVSTPDAAALESWTARLRSVRTVGGVTVSELSLGGTSSLRIAANEGRDWLLYELDQRGLRMEGDGFVREKLPGDAAIVRPKTAEEIAAEQEAAQAVQSVAPTAKPAVAPKPAENAPVDLLPKP